MGAGCCIIGKTEKETLEKSLKWISGWATGIANDLNVVRHSLSRISDGCYGNLHRNYGKSTKKDLCIELDTMNTLIGGIIYQINRAYRDDEDADLLKELAEQFQDIRDQMEDKKPIPTDPFYLWSNPIAGYIKDPDMTVINIPGNYGYWQYKTYEKVFHEIDKIISDADVKNKDNIALLFVSSNIIEDILCRKCLKDGKESIMNILLKEHPGIKKILYYTEKVEEYPDPSDDHLEKEHDLIASDETVESLTNTKRPPRLNQ